ncbi:MAG: hypothetical protein Q4A06_05300, partial [Cardiobacteriaceae bacterium]|nr:hypothetical protein [Cardiobacteriaceae bacterium]
DAGDTQPDVGGSQPEVTPPVIAGAGIVTAAPAAKSASGPVTFSDISREPRDNLFAENALFSNISDNGLVLPADSFSYIYQGYVLNSSLVDHMEWPSDGKKHVKPSVPFKKIGAANNEEEMISIVHIGQQFGYPQARAYHYYGIVDNDPFSLAYTRGELASKAAIDGLKPVANDPLTYSGEASFRAYSYPVNDTWLLYGNGAALETLEKGQANITVRPATKTLDAEIDLSGIRKGKHAFQNIGYSADTASFKHDEAAENKGIRGNFYGKHAEHIGGVYYIPEGSGAFMTEKQP